MPPHFESPADTTIQAFRLNPPPDGYLPRTEVTKDDGRVGFLYEPLPGVVSDPNEEDYELEFKEEPLGVSTKYGFGYLQVEFGDRIGTNSRYEILRKLGWGMQASVWLARDIPNNRFVTIKALTGAMTDAATRGVAFETEILNGKTLNDPTFYCALRIR